MAPFMSDNDFKHLGAPDIAYVRRILGSDLLEHVDESESLDIRPDDTLYAVHGADGQRLAVMLDLDTAVAAVVANELDLVALH